MFFVMKVEGLTHHRLHNPHHKKYFNFELKNIYNLCFNENQVRNQGTTTDWAIYKYILYYWTFNNVHHQLLLKRIKINRLKEEELPSVAYLNPFNHLEQEINKMKKIAEEKMKNRQ